MACQEAQPVSNNCMESNRSPWLVPFFKDVVSWAVFLWGIAIGVLSTTFLASSSVELSNKRDWPKLLGFILLGLLPLLASILGLRNRKHAAYLFLSDAVLADVILFTAGVWWWLHVREQGGDPLMVSSLALAGTTVLLGLPGFFWLMTGRRGWRPLIKQRASPEKPSRQPVVANALLLLLFLSGCAFVSLYRPAGPELNCYKGLPPVSVQSSPRHAVFAGKVLSLGRPWQSWGSPWALVRVERVYWGLPFWMTRIVFVRGYFSAMDKGQEYFVDAHRSDGLLTRFFPVVDEYACCHSTLLSYAKVDLRVIQDGPPTSSVRIIGRVYRRLPDKPRFGFIPNVTVTVTGPQGSVSTVTDGDGIYDLKDLPPGPYSIAVGPSEFGKASLKSGDVWASDLDLVRPHLP